MGKIGGIDGKTDGLCVTVEVYKAIVAREFSAEITWTGRSKTGQLSKVPLFKYGRIVNVISTVCSLADTTYTEDQFEQNLIHKVIKHAYKNGPKQETSSNVAKHWKKQKISDVSQNTENISTPASRVYTHGTNASYVASMGAVPDFSRPISANDYVNPSVYSQNHLGASNHVKSSATTSTAPNIYHQMSEYQNPNHTTHELVYHSMHTNESHAPQFYQHTSQQRISNHTPSAAHTKESHAPEFYQHMSHQRISNHTPVTGKNHPTTYSYQN